jgi:hypothetical protein
MVPRSARCDRRLAVAYRCLPLKPRALPPPRAGFRLFRTFMPRAVPRQAGGQRLYPDARAASAVMDLSTAHSEVRRHAKGCTRGGVNFFAFLTARLRGHLRRTRGLAAPQSRPVQPAPWSRRRLAALERCISSSRASVFSLSRVIFDFGTSVLRSLSSTWPTESLFISAIVNPLRVAICVLLFQAARKFQCP